MSDLRRELLKIIRELSYEKREVTLASGKKSDFYIDLKHTLLNSRGGWLASTLILEKIQALIAQGVKLKGVGGPTMGADPLTTGVSILSQSSKTPLHACYIRKELKDHGSKVWVEGGKNFKPGDKTVILEDVVTTGGSTLKSIDKAREFGLDVIATICVVDRNEGGRQNIESRGIKFDSLFTKEEVIGS